MEIQGVFFFMVFFVVIVIIVYTIIQDMKRAKELREWGEKRGLRYTTKDRAMDDAFPQFSCLHQGHSRYADNILTGMLHGVSICAFDYHYTIGSGKNQSKHSFSGLMVNTGLPLKPLFIRNENFFDKIGEFIGFDDIDFESTLFNDQFYVKSPDKKWAYDVLHQKAMEYLLSAPRFTLDFQGPFILAYRNKLFELSDLEDAYQVVKDLLQLFPDYLMQELKGEIS